MPMLPSSAAPGDPKAASSAGGVIPNFAAEGANLIRLEVGAFDPLSDALPTQSGIAQVAEASLAPGTAQYWLLQVKDSKFAEADAAVQNAGGIVAGFLPENTYIVRATTVQKAAIASDSSVRWMGFYQPAWRVPVASAGKQGLLELTGTRVYEVGVFRTEPNAAQVRQAIDAIHGVEVVNDDLHVVQARATSAEVPAIAALSGVEWVSVKPTVVLLNSNARWVTDTGVRDLLAATAPGRLTGAGQTAGVADTGINYTYDLNGRAHVAFRDCDPGTLMNCKKAEYTQAAAGTSTAQMTTVTDNNTNHRKVVAFFDLGNTGPNPFDESSHGSHTTGSVTGDQAPYGTPNGEDGMAPGAMLVSQNIGTASGGLAIPSDLYQLFRQAYRPRKPASVPTSSPVTGNPIDFTAGCADPAGATAASPCYRPLEDARTHNDSWGLVAPLVDDGKANDLDQFVWDNEDMLISVSAGNSGPAPGSIGSPSTAKNNISSAASANGRQPMASIDSIAVFSSHGPTADGRLGPDVATPGQIVVSVKGGTNDGYHTAQGTSMSSPILTGLSTLVRQYFFDGYAAGDFGAGSVGGGGFAAGAPDDSRRHDPSAALVKAALINGAVRMRGFYSGNDGSDRAQDGQWPSWGQGFGRVNLDNSLYFAGDPSNNWYMDVYRGDVNGKQECVDAGGLAQTDCTSFPLGVNAQRQFKVHVEPGKPLDVTLDWTDFGSSAAAGTSSLVNDLNLKVTGPNGATYIGNNFNSVTDPTVAVARTPNNATAPPDNRNLTERVRVDSPDLAAGDYTITVSAPAIARERQGFALAASGNISKFNGPVFVPGPELQVDQSGSPVISNVAVTTPSANTAKVTFQTNEPTTATATANVVGGSHTFIDSYNIKDDSDWPGLDIGTVETSAGYADKPMVGTKHEILLTGFTPGQNATVTLKAKDLASPDHEVSQSVTVKTPSSVFQANAPDIGQLAEDAAGGWKTGTQLYASDDGGSAGLLGAFMFRIPEGAVNPANITGAAIELTSSHNWTIPYIGDPQLTVDLLPSALEPDWGTQDYQTIHESPADARVPPETTHLRGAYQEYDFTFQCGDLQKLKDTLAASNGERDAAFRYDATQATPEQLFAMEFGFNRRSRGPDLRPKLVLFTNNNTNPEGEACDPNTPAPAISNLGIHEGVSSGNMTVSWETDVPSNSFVIFREKSTTAWTQVGTPARTKIHQVEVFGLDPDKHYEFAVRSAACNGAASTDTNGGKGYDFFVTPPSLGDPTVEATYDFETGAEGWTAQTVEAAPDETPDTQWQQGTPGASNTTNPDGSRSEDASKHGWKAKPYFDSDEAFLKAPAAVAFSGTVGAVEVFMNHDLEQAAAGLFTPIDALKIEVSRDNGGSWQTVAAYQQQSPNYPDYVFRRATFPIFSGNGPVLVRFNLLSDDNTSFPPYMGAAVDKVSFVSYSPPPSDEPAQPAQGPAPPPSAGATGLTVPFRFGSATQADIASGTGVCDVKGNADLTLGKHDSADPSKVNKPLSYYLNIKNKGPDDASGVKLVDNLPSSAKFVSSATPQGTCAYNSSKHRVTCQLGDVARGAALRVTIVVKPTQTGRLVNRASISSTSPADPNLSNNSAGSTTQIVR